MQLDDLSLLRLHLEAVWHLSLNPITGNNGDIPSASKQPDWRLYSGQLRSGQRINVWRADVSQDERLTLMAQLTQRADESMNPASANIQREVALIQDATAAISLAQAQQIARPLTQADHDLIEAYEAGSANYYLQPSCAPVFGAIVNGQLCSIAHSSRRTAQACELGVETLPQARQRGLALAVTTCWTAAVVAQGLLPIYSALTENHASLRLAHAAGYRWFVKGIQIR